MTTMCSKPSAMVWPAGQMTEAKSGGVTVGIYAYDPLGYADGMNMYAYEAMIP